MLERADEILQTKKTIVHIIHKRMQLRGAVSETGIHINWLKRLR